MLYCMQDKRQGDGKMDQQEWLSQVREAFGLDHGVGQELDFEYVARFWARYGSDYCHEFGSVGHGLVWALQSARFSGVLVGWLRQQEAEEVAELLAEL